MIKNKCRAGVAMIELIFAIVIMGIVLMSAPMLVSQAGNSAILGVQQEAIAAASTNLGMILTRHWDEQDTNESRESPVLLTDSTVTALKEAVDVDGNLIGRRIGTPKTSYRSFLTSLGDRLNATTVSNFTQTDLDDIDDFNGQVVSVGLPSAGDATTTAEGDYIDTTLQLTTAVSYINDAPSTGSYNSETMGFNSPFSAAATGTSNIKALSTTATSGSHDADLQTNVTLRAFSCNIGIYILEERNF